MRTKHANEHTLLFTSMTYFELPCFRKCVDPVLPELSIRAKNARTLCSSLVVILYTITTIK
jgi:hypothetical protein